MYGKRAETISFFYECRMEFLAERMKRFTFSLGTGKNISESGNENFLSNLFTKWSRLRIGIATVEEERVRKWFLNGTRRILVFVEVKLIQYYLI